MDATRDVVQVLIKTKNKNKKQQKRETEREREREIPNNMIFFSVESCHEMQGSSKHKFMTSFKFEITKHTWWHTILIPEH